MGVAFGTPGGTSQQIPVKLTAAVSQRMREEVARSFRLAEAEMAQLDNRQIDAEETWSLSGIEPLNYISAESAATGRCTRELTAEMGSANRRLDSQFEKITVLSGNQRAMSRELEEVRCEVCEVNPRPSIPTPTIATKFRFDMPTFGAAAVERPMKFIQALLK